MSHMAAEQMAFSYTNGNTVEWLVPGDNIVIKMTAAQGDDDFARIWFEDAEGQLVGRGEYQLRRNGPDGEVAPYTGDNWGYIVDYRKNYTMAGPEGTEVFTLSQQKQQSWFSQVDYIVRRPDGTIHKQRIADVGNTEVAELTHV